MNKKEYAFYMLSDVVYGSGWWCRKIRPVNPVTGTIDYMEATGETVEEKIINAMEKGAFLRVWDDENKIDITYTKLLNVAYQHRKQIEDGYSDNVFQKLCYGKIVWG